MSLADPVLKRWPIFAFAVSAAMLLIAHAFQTFGGLAPCHLCLKQREVYWAALSVSLLAIGVRFVLPQGRPTRIANLILALVFAYGVYLAAYQAGAEWKWWPAPATCTAGGHVSMDAVKALIAGHATATPDCDKAAWIFLGLSLAGWNVVISIGLVLASLAAALRKETPA